MDSKQRLPQPASEAFRIGLLITLIQFGFGFTPSNGEGPANNVLRLARITDPATLDPAFVNSTEDELLLFLVHKPLIDLERGTNLVPSGARTWEISPDARRLTFRLRDDIRFSNDRPVFAEDYRFQLERIVDPTTASWQQSYLSSVRGYSDFVDGRTNRLVGLTAPSADTLVIELDHPDPPLPFFLALIAFPVPKESVHGPGAAPSTRPVGCGPYRLIQWQRGARLIFDKNPNNTPSPDRRFDRVEVEIGGDEMTHLMRFERGEIAIANIVGNGVPLSDLRRLSRDPQWGPLIEVIPGMNVSYVSLNTEIPPLNDRRVRQALNYAVDKPRRMLTRQRQFVPASGPVPPTLPGYDPAVQGYSYDVAKARALLAETGLSLPIRLPLLHPNDQRSRMVAEGVQEDFRLISVEAELRATSPAQMFELAGRRGRVAMALFVYNAWPDPRDVIATVFDGRNLHDTEPFNVMFYNNPQVNQLVDAAAASSSNPERFEFFRRAERIVIADAPCIFLGHANLFTLRQRWLRGDPILEPFGIYRLDRAWREPGFE